MSSKKKKPVVQAPSAQVITPEEIGKLTPEEKMQALQRYMGMLARASDDVVGFEAFYSLTIGKKLPGHARKWIEEIYAHHKEGKGSVIQAFRGSTKTTSVTIAFTAFRIGHEPHRANLLIQVGDEIAMDNTKAIGDIIANSPGWKLCFPHVVPDIERGWGAGGYEVKRVDMPYEQWRTLNAARKDPTLVGVGYKSREIIGKHPDGVLIVDDIHDENNTSSERELATVIKILTGTIFPTMTQATWSVFIGTPWTKNDTLAYVASTGRFGLCNTPVYDVVKEGTQGAVEQKNMQLKLAWPDRFDLKEIERQEALAGVVEFARMFLLDLSKAGSQVFKFFSYPHDRINTSEWIVVGGVDYAGTHDPFINREGKRDYFALAYVCKLPGGGAVVFDGVSQHLTQAESEIMVKKAQNMFPFWQACVVETDGKGEEFYQMLYRNPDLKLVPMKTGGKGKEARLVKQMAPWLESGRVRISDAETPFLNMLRMQLRDYPNVEHDDCLDALYWALRGMPDVLVLPSAEQDLPAVRAKKRAVNPFVELGRI